MFGLTFEKLLLIGVIAAFIIGPERLPLAAEKLREFVRWARDAAGGAKERLKEEMGDEFDDVDWRKLDPRQYDPRRIIREALLEDDPAPARVAAATSPGEATRSTIGATTGVASGAEIGGPALAAGLAAGTTAAAAAAAAAVSGASGESRAADDHDDPVAKATPFDPEAT